MIIDNDKEFNNKIVNIISSEVSLFNDSVSELYEELGKLLSISIIFISSEEDIIYRFTAGTDDYFVKTFTISFSINLVNEKVEVLFSVEHWTALNKLYNIKSKIYKFLILCYFFVSYTI